MKQITKEEYDKALSQYHDSMESVKLPKERRHEQIFRAFPELFDKYGKERVYEFDQKELI